VALTERASQGKSTVVDLEGGTFTITNLGSLEIEQFMPIINVPECAILGVGAIIKKPVVISDLIGIRPMLALTLAFDHRLVDGAPAARFLQRVKHLIETPPEARSSELMFSR
jgi:pyruvate dehydrogenase E2 component (dihydrolipoamide acetyltransferase)